MSAILTERADANYFHSWRIIDGAADGGEVLEQDGLLLVSSALSVAWINLAFVTRPLADPAAAIARAAAFFDERGLPFVVRIREGVDTAAEGACEAHGLPFSDVVPGLVMAPIARPPAPIPQLEIRTAAGSDVMQHHRDVVAAAFGFPGGMLERFMRQSLVDVAGCEFYVGYLAGTAVASSALMMSDGVAGIYNVGCVPDARKQGLGEAMTWHAVRRGVELGCDIASLQASEMGRPIYERMGFRLVAPYRTFVRRT